MKGDGGGSLFAATELVNVRIVHVDYHGPVELDTGDTIIHAVLEDVMSPVCGQNSRRLLPTGLPWTSQFPGHLQRCARCAAICPVD